MASMTFSELFNSGMVVPGDQVVCTGSGIGGFTPGNLYTVLGHSPSWGWLRDDSGYAIEAHNIDVSVEFLPSIPMYKDQDVSDEEAAYEKHLRSEPEESPYDKYLKMLGMAPGVVLSDEEWFDKFMQRAVEVVNAEKEPEEIYQPTPKPTTEGLVADREKTHGRFVYTARVAQELKEILSEDFDRYNMVQAEGLDMICSKLSRIACGNPNEPDHWDDIAGYAKMVADYLRG